MPVRHISALLLALALLSASAGCAPVGSTGNGTHRPPTTANGIRPRSTTPPDVNAPYGPTGAWHLVFSDRFEGTALDANHWSTCYYWDCTNRSQTEQEWYQPSQVTVNNGTVSLTAIPAQVHGEQYLSGMISSYGKFSFQYGYAQIVAKLPTGQGLWSAFWAEPESGIWPPEIDIMENWAQRDIVNMFVHFSQYARTGAGEIVPTFDTAFHTYGVDWEPGSISWYVDGVQRAHFAVAIFEPEYLIANLAVSTNPGPDASVHFPQSMVIRSIQVWQHPPGSGIPAAP